MKQACTIFILLIACTIASTQTKEKNYEEAFELISVWLEAQKDFDRLPGISAAVTEDQDLLWSGGFGWANPDKKVQTDAATLCSICSISKLFTSVAVMKLYDEGKIRLDEDVSTYLPHYDLNQKYPDSGPVTIRSLLTHSSGLPREAKSPYWTGPDFPFPEKSEIVDKLSDQETLYPASTYFQYSNLGLTLLGQVVEEVSGRSFEDYVQDEILNPLGLSDTRPEMPEQLYGEQLAIGYASMNRAGEREKVPFFQANGITPAAGFSSNVTDLGKFASWQFRLRDSTITEILKPSTLRNMQQVHYMDPNWKVSWGLGFAVYKGGDGKTWVGHGGSCPGYRSQLSIDLGNKRAYSVMINASGTSPKKYVDGIHAILGKVEKVETDDVKKVDLEAYKGFYRIFPWWGELYVGSWNNKLVVIGLPSDDPADDLIFYKHIEGDTFRRIRDDKSLGETLIFSRDEEDRITQCSRHDNFMKKIEN